MRKDVLINFESEKREGIVAVGTYLMDAAKRLGVPVNDECRKDSVEHNCAMKVASGTEMLSAPTALELELLSEGARKAGERLSCQTRIEKPGEISIMSVKKEKETTTESKKSAKGSDQFKREFEQLPLEKKIASLVELEAIALGETFSYVLNSPYAVAGKFMDVLAEFGLDLEKKDRDAKRPEEHKEKKSTDADKKASETKGSSAGGKTRKKPVRKTKAKKKE